MIEDFDFSLKIIIVGNGRVGKSSLITRFAKGTYSDEYKKTLGVSFLEKRTYIQAIGKEVAFHLWDTAGQEEYDELTREYYKGSCGCILAFSTTDIESYKAVEKWKKKVEEQCGNIPMIIVQTKLDLESTEGKITEDEAKSLADKLNLTLFRISTKKDFRVKDIFEYLTNVYCKLSNENFKENKEEIQLGEIKKKEIRKKSDNEIFSEKEKEIKIHKGKKEKNKDINLEKEKDKITKNEKEKEIDKEKEKDKGKGKEKEKGDKKEKEDKKKKKKQEYEEAEENERQNEILRKNLEDKKNKICAIF